MKSDLDKLRPLQRQAYLSKAVILESKIDIDAKKYEEQIHERLLKVLDFTIVDTENAIIKENKITITSPDNFIELKTTKLEFQNKFDTSGTMSLDCDSSSNYVGTLCDFKVIKDNEEIIYKT